MFLQWPDSKRTKGLHLDVDLCALPSFAEDVRERCVQQGCPPLPTIYSYNVEMWENREASGVDD